MVDRRSPSSAGIALAGFLAANNAAAANAAAAFAPNYRLSLAACPPIHATFSAGRSTTTTLATPGSRASKAGWWPALSSSAGNRRQDEEMGGGGSGVFYDADPSAMNAAYVSSASSSSLSKPDASAPSARGAERRERFVHPPGTLPRDVVIVGSGLAGLSAALRLATTTNHHVTLLEREDPLGQMARTTAGSFAAAGMLAPQSERLPSGPLLDLCLRSREMYSEWVGEVEEYARNSGDEGRRYLWDDGKSSQVSSIGGGNVDVDVGEDDGEPWTVGYTSTGGFLAPAFAGDSVATWAPPPQTTGGKASSVKWLDAVQARELEPLLHPEVVGGWWFPEDASVDARRLVCALRAACVGRGVDFRSGKGNECVGLELSDGLCRGVRLADGRTLSARSVVLANGSWMRDLLPVPVVPHKGQSLSLRMPKRSADGSGARQPPLLSRVLFAQDTYIVPKSDGRIVVGATVEAGSFDPSVTPSGLSHVMAGACRLVPALADLPVEETWAGLRPTTPDKGPILGRAGGMADNLYLAGGYWRNGVLLAPKTGQLLGDLIAQDRGSAAADDAGGAAGIAPEDEALLGAFSWDRFTSPEGGGKMAADARYAASMHPVHKYSTGLGVSAAVGTELGFYSDASEAKAERARDREGLFAEDAGGDGGFSTGSEEDAFERAARMGRDDAKAFTLGDPAELPRTPAGEDEELSSEKVAEASGHRHVMGGEPFNGAPDAFTVGSSGSSSVVSDDSTTTGEVTKGGPLMYDDVYKKVRNVRTASGEHREADESIVQAERIPDLLEMQIKEQKEYIDAFTHPEILDEAEAKTVAGAPDGGKPSYDETTYDGYQAILEKNWGASQEDLKARMKAARMSNRAKASTIDESKIGVLEMPEDLSDETAPSSPLSSPDEADAVAAREEEGTESSDSDSLSSVYGKIAANKAQAAATEMEDALPDGRLDPGFRIYHVDSETGERREIPPYTRPEAFAQTLEEEREATAEKSAESNGEGAEVVSAMAAESSDPTQPVASNDGQATAGDVGSKGEKDYDETTYDGYQAILEKNWGASQDDIKARMKAARVSNRAKASTIDESKIGVLEMPDLDDSSARGDAVAEVEQEGTDGDDAENAAPSLEESLRVERTDDLSALYQGILSNKQRAAEDVGGAVDMGEAPAEERPDPGFRIYHVDSETGEKREIPPYTKPEVFASMIEVEKKRRLADADGADGDGGV